MDALCFHRSFNWREGGGGLGFYYILQIIIYKIIKGEEKLEMKNII